MKIVVPDYVSNSYFPAIAAKELGCFRDEGIEAELKLLFPVTRAADALHAGDIDILVGAAHAPLHVTRGGSGFRLLSKVAENTYWFLVVRSDSPIEPGCWEDLKDLTIGAAPGPDLGLLRTLEDHGIDRDKVGITVGPIPTDLNTDTATISFGLSAAKALSEGRIDAFWANGMGAEVALRQGVGKVIADARRDGGPSASLTFPAAMTTEKFIATEPEQAAAAVRSLVRAQEMLKADPSLAASIGALIFPPLEASLIQTLIERDTSFYAADITENDIAGLSRLGRASGLIDSSLTYADYVAVDYAQYWSKSKNPSTL